MFDGIDYSIGIFSIVNRCFMTIGVSEFIGSIPTIFQYYRNNGYHEL